MTGFFRFSEKHACFIFGEDNLIGQAQLRHLMETHGMVELRIELWFGDGSSYLLEGQIVEDADGRKMFVQGGMAR